MQDKESIYKLLVDMLVDLFEIEAEQVNPSASLLDDLDIDSIDAVDMSLQLNELTGKKIKPEEFRDIRTVQDVVDVVYDMMNSEPAAS